MPLVIPSVRFRYVNWLPWLVLLVSMVITYHLWRVERDGAVQRLQDDFDFSVRESSERIEQRLLAYEQVLRGAQGLFYSTANVNREIFHTYVINQHFEDNYSGIQGVGFSLIVPPELKEKHIASVRKEITRTDIPPYTIKPEGNRSIYTSIIYLEPFSGRNLRAFGFDMYSEPIRRKAMEQARDSGKACVSGRVTLVQETEKEVQSGFLMYLPVYKNGSQPDTVAERQANIIGWVYSPFRMGDLMQGILGERSAELDYEIYDGDEVSENKLMYDSGNRRFNPENARFQTIQIFKLAGHHWTLFVRSSHTFETRLDTYRSELIAISGIGGSLLLTLVIWLLVNGRRRANEYAIELNRELMKSEQSLQIESDKNLIILNSISEGLHGLSKDGTIIFENPAAIKMLGWGLDELIGKPAHITMHHTHADGSVYPQDECHIYATLKDGVTRHVQNEVFWRKDGTSFPIDYTSTPMRNHAGEIVGAIVSFHDITERKRTEENLRINASVFGISQEAIVLTDAINNIIDVNPAFTRITGFSRDDVIGKNPRLLSSEKHDKKFYEELWKSLQEKGLWRGEIWNRRKSGEIYPEMLSISVLRDSDGKVLRHVAVFSDISNIKRHEAELVRVAHFDALTSIPNRILLADRMKQAISQTSRDKNMMAVCYLDLDRFKPINDALGHQVGDDVLIEIARRIGFTIRGGDTVARLGGDEFVVLLLGLSKGEECVATLERLLDAIAAPITVKGKILSVSASIGVSIYPHDEEDPDILLRHADQAMYVAKNAGKNRFHIYDVELDKRARDQNEFLKSIRFALEHNQFELHYQPKVDLRTKELVGAEALIRWKHPERGLLAPSEFLRHIENTDLDIEIGEWVTVNALAQIHRWQRIGLDIEVSINISGYHMESTGFVDKLQQQLANYPNLPFGKLQIEVLETVALNDITKVQEIIKSCRKIGVGFALDDFGTGYSSLSYLSGLPVDTLKIDQSFVRDMLEDKGDRAIVQGIIALAKAFERQTVAEGIETDEHYQALLDMGCEIGQGYGIARPMPASELMSWKLNYR